MGEREYWLGFSALSLIGPAKFKKILAEFGSAKKAWEAASLARRPLARLFGESFAGKFDIFRSKFSIKDMLKK